MISRVDDILPFNFSQSSSYPFLAIGMVKPENEVIECVETYQVQYPT